MIIIDFAFDTKHGKFSDALHLPDDHTYSDEELTTMKQERVNNWISFIDAASLLVDENVIVDDSI